VKVSILRNKNLNPPSALGRTPMIQDVNGDPIPVPRRVIPLLGDGYGGISLPMGMDMGKFLTPSGLQVRVWDSILRPHFTVGPIVGPISEK
jgi:hypothetical protein